MRLLRTPEERFVGLPDFAFRPHYVDDLPGYPGIRLHHVDEGASGGAPVALCLHGNPTWSYLYRWMLPVFLQAGMRVVAPDIIGFGRSDKPADEADHHFDFHRTSLLRLIERLDLRDVMLVCQDWGGIFGLTLLHEMPERFTRLLVMNTTLATGAPPTPGFAQWRDYSNRTPDMDVGKLIARGKPEMTAAQAAGYNAPYPDASYKAALRAFPNLVPDRPDAPGAAVSRVAADFLANAWNGRSFMAIGKQDPVLGGAPMQALRSLIRGCPPPLEIAEGGHFLQEWGAPIAQAALQSFGLARAPGAR